MVVRTTVSTDEVVIEVEDAGPGLDQADLINAFERGTLHAKYRDVRNVGTGLGLSIAHRLASRMRVRLEVRAASGGGAVFSVHLPSI